jgi:stage V sporulation protein G
MVDKLDVRVYPIDEPKGDTKAFASIALNDLVAIRGIRVVEDNKGLFITMPQSKDNKTGKYHDIAFPLNGELRKEFTRAVLGEHDRQINLSPEERGYPPPDKDAPPIKIDLDKVQLDMRVYPLDDPKGNVQAFASLSVDNLIAIRGVRVIEGDEGLFVAMPQTQDKRLEYHDVAFPLTKELRDEITKIAIDKFENPDRAAERKPSLTDKLAAGADKAAGHTAPERVAAKSKNAGVLE